MANALRLRRIHIEPLQIPFKVRFRHATADRTETSSISVKAVSDRGTSGYGEGCPRPYVTGETIDSAVAFVTRHEDALLNGIRNLESMRDWMRAHIDDLDANPAAWCAIELALLDLMAREDGQTVERFLSLPELSGSVRYSAVLGDADGAAFQESAERYGRHGFSDFKIKLSGSLDRDREKVAVLRGMGLEPSRVRADANNLWEDGEQAIRFLRDLEFPFFAVEEPIRPNQYTELARIGDHVNCRIVLDESFLRAAQAAMLPGAPTRWLINLRVSKMGGLLRSLDIVDMARREGIGLVIGAQVGETSLLTRAALTVAHVARDLTVAQEGAFGTFLLDHDIWDPTLMFGAGGVLDVAHFPTLREPGFGLTMLGSPVSTPSSQGPQDEGGGG